MFVSRALLITLGTHVSLPQRTYPSDIVDRTPYLRFSKKEKNILKLKTQHTHGISGTNIRIIPMKTDISGDSTARNQSYLLFNTVAIG